MITTLKSIEHFKPFSLWLWNDVSDPTEEESWQTNQAWTAKRPKVAIKDHNADIIFFPFRVNVSIIIHLHYYRVNEVKSPLWQSPQYSDSNSHQSDAICNLMQLCVNIG